MKNIKYFKYKDTEAFKKFLDEYGYSIDDAKGFKFIDQRQYHGNVLKVYFICLNDGEEVYFKVAVFKSFNEYRQSALGFNGNKLLEWFEDSNVRKYKVKGW